MDWGSYWHLSYPVRMNYGIRVWANFGSSVRWVSMCTIPSVSACLSLQNLFGPLLTRILCNLWQSCPEQAQIASTQRRCSTVVERSLRQEWLTFWPDFCGCFWWQQSCPRSLYTDRYGTVNLGIDEVIYSHHLFRITFELNVLDPHCKFKVWSLWKFTSMSDAIYLNLFSLHIPYPLVYPKGLEQPSVLHSYRFVSSKYIL